MKANQIVDEAKILLEHYNKIVTTGLLPNTCEVQRCTLGANTIEEANKLIEESANSEQVKEFIRTSVKSMMGSAIVFLPQRGDQYGAIQEIEQFMTRFYQGVKLLAEQQEGQGASM